MKKTEKPSETPLEAPKSAETPEPSLDGSTLLSDLQRTRADFENYRKNVEKEKENFGKLIKFSTVEKVLPLLDDLDRAISAYPKELKPLEKNFAKALKNLELEKIETAPGTEFNPELHEAVLVEPSDGEKEVIKETLRPGYFYQGEILRPAMVKVEHV
ncbi:nucleotide exchange factor GrpE [Candidatus Saccharibacteria bacterium]|nr:nucleotide exchange factor GrpE [Candidatus Saccharibacteria bacterium]MBQ6605391.1 nucleotide exchange factor GrpE [Candidatus Saccharibacteria bacterium]